MPHSALKMTAVMSAINQGNQLPQTSQLVLAVSPQLRVWILLSDYGAVLQEC